MQEKEKSENEETIPITEKVGDIVKIIKEAVKKEILNVGDSPSKPCDIDNVVIEYKLFLHSGELVDKSDSFIEFDLGESPFPEGVNKSILTMRKNEVSKIVIRAKYGCNIF